MGLNEFMVGSAHPASADAPGASEPAGGEGVEPDLAAWSGNVLIWEGKQVGLLLRTLNGKNHLSPPPGAAGGSIEPRPGT